MSMYTLISNKVIIKSLWQIILKSLIYKTPNLQTIYLR